MKRLMQAACDGGEGDSVPGSVSAWMCRSYGVIAVLAPVMTTHADKIEFPGDPMCLYAALSVAVTEAVKARSACLGPDDSYNDLCPRWGELPSPECRAEVSDDGIRRNSGAPRNTDDAVFDPRVWNDEVKQYFTELVATLQPRVVLVSTVSPAHRYAIDIARIVRRTVPRALIAFGGRHLDETMRFNDATRRLETAYSNTLEAIRDGRIEPVVDFLVSGDGYFALDLLMKAISVAMDLENKVATVRDVVRVLHAMAPGDGVVRGRAVLAAVDGGDVHVFPIRAADLDLASLPSPYRAFAVRARFPIFEGADRRILRTAHVTVTNACPFHCDFCSEAVTVVGRLLRFQANAVATAVDRICEYVSYGAEAAFFDDSVFWAGDIGRMVEFSDALRALKTGIATEPNAASRWLKNAADWQRLADFQWAAQLTFEFLTTLQTREKALELLRAMRAAGCVYIYFGIESLAPPVMAGVHKYLRRVGAASWADKAWEALRLVREARLRAGCSVLFGLHGETRATIEETIDGVARLIDAGLVDIASPNICTYHPGTALTRLHKKEHELDYHSLDVPNRPPYVFFEEAFPKLVSRELSESDIWYIHHQTRARWGVNRNMNLMRETVVPVTPSPTAHTALESTSIG